MKTAALNIEVRLDDRAERISTLDQALSFVQRLVDEVGGFVDRRKRALQVERDGRLRLGHALLQIQPALSKAGLFHEFIAGLRMNQRTVQEMLRITRKFSTGGVFDLAKVDAARHAVAAFCDSHGGDMHIRAILDKPNAATLNTKHLYTLAKWVEKANHPTPEQHAQPVALDVRVNPNLSRAGDNAHARALDVRVEPNLSRAGQPTHQPPAVSGLQVEHGDKVVWSAQLGRWMVEIGEVLYELHEYTRVRKGETVVWPGGVTPAGYDEDDDELDDDLAEDPNYDGDEHDDWDDDEDAAFADDEPLEDDEDDDVEFDDAAPSGRNARGLRASDDAAPAARHAAAADHRGASGQQLTFAGLFEAADGIARAMADLTTKLQHDPLISQRDLDAAERAVDDAKLAIAEARHRLTEERP